MRNATEAGVQARARHQPSHTPANLRRQSRIRANAQTNAEGHINELKRLRNTTHWPKRRNESRIGILRTTSPRSDGRIPGQQADDLERPRRRRSESPVGTVPPIPQRAVAQHDGNDCWMRYGPDCRSHQHLASTAYSRTTAVEEAKTKLRLGAKPTLDHGVTLGRNGVRCLRRLPTATASVKHKDLRANR